MGYATTNPYTGEVVQEFPYATDAEVDAALKAGHAAFRVWRTTPFEERSRLMSNAARLMRERREEFARLNTLEMGKLYSEALGEANVVAGIFDHYARHTWTSPTRRTVTRWWCSSRSASCWLSNRGTSRCSRWPAHCPRNSWPATR